MVYRIDPVLARQQATWMVVGLVLFAVTILALRREGVACSSATATRSPPWRSADGAAAAARDRPAGQRRLPRDPLRQRRLPALRAREDRDRHVPGELPARQPPDPRDRGPARARGHAPADEAVRPDAGRLGRGDGHAADHARAGDLADVLRRVSCAAVRGHRAPVVPADRPACCSRSAPGYLAGHVSHVHARVLAWEHPFDPALYKARSVAATSSPSRCSRRPTGGCSAAASTSRCCAGRHGGGRSCRSPKAT